MKHQNHSPAKRATRSKTPSPGKGISQSDLRRSTYTPGRPAGVHARELKKKS